jgi:tetraacyldisaccharide 4'-kinase
MLQRLEAEIVAFVAFPDHHAYTRSEIDRLVCVAKQHSADVLVTTEKDGVRLRRLQPSIRQVWELRIRAVIMEQEAAWETRILDTIWG